MYEYFARYAREARCLCKLRIGDVKLCLYIAFMDDEYGLSVNTLMNEYDKSIISTATKSRR